MLRSSEIVFTRCIVQYRHFFTNFSINRILFPRYVHCLDALPGNYEVIVQSFTEWSFANSGRNVLKRPTFDCVGRISSSDMVHCLTASAETQINEVNIEFARTMNKITFLHILKPNAAPYARPARLDGSSSSYTALSLSEPITEEPKRACPERGTVWTPDYNYPELFSEMVRLQWLGFQN